MLNGNAAGAETVPSRLRAKSPFFTESEPNNLTNEGLSSPVFVKLLFQRLHSLSWLLLTPTCVLLRSSPAGGKMAANGECPPSATTQLRQELA